MTDKKCFACKRQIKTNHVIYLQGHPEPFCSEKCIEKIYVIPTLTNRH